jgi:hypothetical protein
MSTQALSSMASMRATTALWARTVMEKSTSWSTQAAMTLCDQKPESARNVSFPVAPARRMRPMVSRTNRCAPRAVFALPLRMRACSTSPVSARVASSGW